MASKRCPECDTVIPRAGKSGTCWKCGASVRSFRWLADLVALLIGSTVVIAIAYQCGTAPSTPPTRAERIDDLFSPWGENIAMRQAIKNQLTNPASYEHVRGQYIDHGSFIEVRMTFRANNAFGQPVIGTAKGKLSLGGALSEFRIE